MWSANQWSILGIEATTDISKIKAAYAEKAKLVHPEEYPEEFQELQKAYKSAVKYAKLQNTYKITVENNNPSNDRDIVQDISDTQTTLDKENISNAKAIREREIKLDKKAVFKPDNIVKEETISDESLVLETENISKKETTSDKTIVFESENVSKEEKITDKRIAFESKNIIKPENVFDKKILSNQKAITWKAITPEHKETVIDNEQEFVYDEISYEEKSQQCILDMICLAKNIYLINDIRCWEWFFTRDEYKELYNLCHKLEMTIEKNSGKRA